MRMNSTDRFQDKILEFHHEIPIKSHDSCKFLMETKVAPTSLIKHHLLLIKQHCWIEFSKKFSIMI